MSEHKDTALYHPESDSVKGHKRETSCKDSHEACTWLPESNCAENGCKLQGPLACRWNPWEYNFIMGIIQTPPVLIMLCAFTIVGVITGNWWSMAIFGWVMIMWPLGLETFVLCRHCPYFSDNKKTLTCWALRYMPKWWKYNPRPLNRMEKFVVVYLLFIIPMFLWPVGWTVYGVYYMATNYQAFGQAALLGMIGMCFAVAVCGIQFFLVLWANNCPRCVNFSCPFNKVPKERVDAYLMMNPGMMEAWIKQGYKLGEVGKK
jgi:hypothetical protein